jgi:hypothetical protein
MVWGKGFNPPRMMTSEFPRDTRQSAGPGRRLVTTSSWTTVLSPCSTAPEDGASEDGASGAGDDWAIAKPGARAKTARQTAENRLTFL